ncbi:hypothetical protein D3C81_1633760 [compost metagenome]
MNHVIHIIGIAGHIVDHIVAPFPQRPDRTVIHIQRCNARLLQLGADCVEIIQRLRNLCDARLLKRLLIVNYPAGSCPCR